MSLTAMICYKAPGRGGGRRGVGSKVQTHTHRRREKRREEKRREEKRREEKRREEKRREEKRDPQTETQKERDLHGSLNTPHRRHH
jgi:hypothetical protein